MAANMFKKYVNLFVKNKSTSIVIQRKNDCYYICDGFIMLKLPAVFYNGYVRPVSPIFPDLPEGQNAIRKPGEALAELAPENGNMADLLDKFNADNPAQLTRLLCLNDQNKLVRYVKIGENKMSVYNNDFITAAQEFIDDENVKATSDRYPVLKWENTEMQIACVIMPVNFPGALTALKDVSTVF